MDGLRIPKQALQWEVAGFKRSSVVVKELRLKDEDKDKDLGRH